MSKKKDLTFSQFDVLKDHEKFMYLKILKKNVDQFFKYNSMIEEYIKRKRPVPALLYDKFINLIIPIESEIVAKYDSIFEEKYNKLKARFINDKRYQFKYQKKGANTAYYSLESMLEEVLYAVLNLDLTNENTKEKCLDLSYITMLKYRDELDLKRKKILLPSKLSAISAYILILFGFAPNQKIIEKINAKQPITHAELFKSVWHHTQKIKIKKA